MRHEGLKDGTTVLLRDPKLDDLERSVRFFQGLPAEDRRYLRVDVTKREMVERRLEQAEAGQVQRIVALDGDEIVADGALEYSGEGWQRHIGEIRAIVALDYRRRRLGALLIQELFRGAQREGVEKVVIKMAASQTAGRKICERLGFRLDAMLPGYIKDADGQLEGLIMMSCTLDHVWRELKDFYDDGNWPDG